MSMELAEKLKEKLTDKYVVVDKSIPELRRFANWTGKVKTVNMSCRALVEFDGPVDISWYDINPDYLIVVDGPQPKAAPVAKAPAAKPAAAEAKPAAAAAKPAATGGKSPLDAIRAQQAAKAAGASAAAPAAAPAAGAKMSPLDMIRKQQAAKAKPEGAAQAAAPAPEAAAPPAPVAAEPPAEPAPPPAAAKPALPTTGPDGRPLSKIELIRMQGAKKS